MNLAIVLSLATTLPNATHLGVPAAQMARTIYVVHSGVHFYLAPPDKNHGAEAIRKGLLRQGIAEDAIVVLDSPFEQATFSNVLPKESVKLFMQVTNPESKVAHDLYVRMHQTLRSLGVPRDTRLVWIGHSAGGQIGMTLAHLGHSHDRFPELRKKSDPWLFEMVVTLGTPVGANPVPPGVKLRHYYSPGDSVIQLLVHVGESLSKSLGLDVRFGPCCDLHHNTKVLCFEGVEHNVWIRSPRFLETLLRERRGFTRPLWRHSHAECVPSLSLGQMLADCLEEECRISLEDPPILNR